MHAVTKMQAVASSQPCIDRCQHLSKLENHFRWSVVPTLMWVDVVPPRPLTNSHHIPAPVCKRSNGAKKRHGLINIMHFSQLWSRALLVWDRCSVHKKNDNLWLTVIPRPARFQKWIVRPSIKANPSIALVIVENMAIQTWGCNLIFQTRHWSTMLLSLSAMTPIDVIVTMSQHPDQQRPSISEA